MYKLVLVNFRIKSKIRQKMEVIGRRWVFELLKTNLRPDVIVQIWYSRWIGRKGHDRWVWSFEVRMDDDLILGMKVQALSVAPLELILEDFGLLHPIRHTFWLSSCCLLSWCCTQAVSRSLFWEHPYLQLKSSSTHWAPVHPWNRRSRSTWSSCHLLQTAQIHGSHHSFGPLNNL